MFSLIHYRLLLIAILSFGLLNSCGNKRIDRGVIGATDPIGDLDIELNVNTSCVRLEECPVGNMVADALQAYALSQAYATDAAIINGGGLRYKKDTRPDGLYPKGPWNEALSNELLPFSNQIAIVSLTGTQLKSTFERAVANLPNQAGSFLQVSKEIKIQVDKSQPAQKISTDQSQITQEGQRIVSLQIAGRAYEPEKIYRIVANDFIAMLTPGASSNDGFVEIRNLSSNQKINLNENLVTALSYYFPIYTPVRPSKEGRISIP